ncbi:MAG TPA: RNA polymerase sigma factor [Candidatus Acidoferrum sp.]|nr:RNA polymerase sigma factor [Candidatus Acidoferrum sp.]
MNFLSAEPSKAWNETDAIHAAQQGDRSAFEFLYQEHSRRVYRVILRILKNVSDAEDLTQQVFLNLFRKIGSFRGESSLSTWLHRVAVNATLMHLRRKRPADVSTDGLDADTMSALAISDNTIRCAPDRMNLARAIRQLPDGCRRLFVMHVVLGYRHQEIAKLLGCSVGSSKSQVHKARKRLQVLLRGFEQAVSNESAAA